MSTHYNPNTIITKGRGLNMVIGARGFGKTFGFKLFTAKRFIKTIKHDRPEQFMYVRITKKQIDRIKDYWGTVGDVINKDSKEVHEFTFKGDECLIDGKVAGYVVALSDYLSYKGQEYPNVKYIILDEFLDTEGWVRKIKPPEALLNLSDSVFRERTDTQIFCLSNAVKLINIYFDYFNIKIDERKQFTLDEDIAVQVITDDAEEFIEKRKSTWFGRLASKTEYAQVALDNSFTDDNLRLVKRKYTDSNLICNIAYGSDTFGVWAYKPTGEVFFTGKAPANPPLTIAVTVDELDDSVVYKKGVQRNVIYQIAIARNNGKLYYDSIRTREHGFDILKKLGIY